MSEIFCAYLSLVVSFSGIEGSKRIYVELRDMPKGVYERTEAQKKRFADLGRAHKCHTEATKARISQAGMGRVCSEATRKKIGEANRKKPHRSGWKHTEASRQQMSQNRAGLPVSAETRAKISAAQQGKKLSEEHKSSISVGLKASGAGASPEQMAQLHEFNRGRKQSPEHQEKNRLGHLGQKPTPETIEKRRIKLKGRPAHPNTIAAVSRTKKGKPLSAEHREKLRLSHLGFEPTPITREKLRQARLKQVLPTKHTSIEIALEAEFRKMGLTFRRHGTLFGRWQPDFIFDHARLVVQADGDYWHRRPGVPEKDERFNQAAVAHGWAVIRFWEKDIRRDASACARLVLDFLNTV